MFSRLIYEAKLTETTVEMTIPEGRDEVEDKIDGEIVSNPLQEALESGACIIAGYD